MFCNHCAAKVVDTAVICVKCGSPLTPAATASASAPESSDKAKKFVQWGYATAVFLPIVGLGLGIYNAVKGRIGHGIGQIVLSIFFWSFWAGFVNGLSGQTYPF